MLLGDNPNSEYGLPMKIASIETVLAPLVNEILVTVGTARIGHATRWETFAEPVATVTEVY
jgi:hypothetical protein